MPEKSTEHGTVGEFYLKHRQALNSGFYFDKPPPKWKGHKGRFMVLEMVIDTEAVRFDCLFVNIILTLYFSSKPVQESKP